MASKILIDSRHLALPATVSWRPVILAVSILFSGCATAELRPKGHVFTEGAGARGVEILKRSYEKRDPGGVWRSSSIMKVVARDVWKSQSIRLLTPVPEASQQIQFAFRISNTDAYMKWVGGPKNNQVIGIENGIIYFIEQGKKIAKPSKRVRWYLPPVRDYFMWPQEIHGFQNITYLGREELGLRTFDKVYATRGLDQYVIWVNSNTHDLEFIEFTLRDLSASFKGAVQYRDFRWAGGMSFPHEIVLLDAVHKPSYSHKFYVQIVSLE